MTWWNKKERVIGELKRLRRSWGMKEDTLQSVVDYIILHPKSVGRDLYKVIINLDVRGM